MTNLNILHGLSTELFSAPGVVNPDLLIEEGCWYLCTDTAELYLGIKDETTAETTLKRINSDESIDPKVIELLNAEISKVNKSLSDYAKKTDIPTVEGLATEEFVQEELNKISIPDVSNFITEAEVEAKGYLTGQDISDKADKKHIHTLTDITDYTAPDLTGYATQEFVSKKIAEAELKDKEADLEAYYTKSEVDALIPNVTDLIKEIPSEYITESELAEELAKIEHPANPTKVSELENDARYATEQYVTDAIANQVPVDNLAKKEEVEEVKTKLEAEVLPVISVVPEVKTTVEELKTTAATQEWVNEQGFITEHQDISNKADKVLFTTAKFVTTPIGNFVMGENIKDLTIAQLYAKLLGLSDTKPGEKPDSIVDAVITNQTPMYAVTPTGSVEAISYELLTYDTEVAETKPSESGFYQIIDADNNVIESGYQQVSAVYTDMPYIIALPKDLDFATNITVKSWNDLESKWEVDDITKNAMSSDAQLFESFDMGALYEDVCPEVDANEYTLWFLEEASTGIIYRFIINE